MNITSALIEDLEDEHGNDKVYEHINKGDGAGRIDTKRLSKEERNQDKEYRANKKNGRWKLVEGMGFLGNGEDREDKE